MKIDSIKMLTIIEYFSLILLLYTIIRIPSTSGYEISIYDIYPWYVWLLIIASFFIAQIVLIVSAYGNQNNQYWVLCFFSMFIVNSILLFMPIIRGYIVYQRADVLTHIGTINDLISTANIGDNYYPIVHIYATFFSLVTNINVEHTVNIIPPIFSMLSLVLIYCLIKYIFKKQQIVLFLLPFTAMLLYSNGNMTFVPSVQSFFLLPLVLFLYIKSRNKKNPLYFSVLLLLLIFLIVFFHPITTFFLIIILSTFKISYIIFQNIAPKISETYKLSIGKSDGIILLCFISFFTWYFSFSTFVGSVRKMFSLILSESGGDTTFQSYSNLYVYVKPSMIDLFNMAFYTYGTDIIIGIMALIFSMYFLLIRWRNKGDLDLTYCYYILFSLNFLLFFALSILFFFNDYVIGFSRVYKYSIFFGSIVIGLGFHSLFIEKINLIKFRNPINLERQKYLKICLLCFILICLLYISTFNLYFSPLIKRHNFQVSEMEIEGMTWFFNQRNDDLEIKEILIHQNRFHDMIFGISSNKKNIRSKNTEMMSHFGYTNNSTLKDYYNESTYYLFPIQAESYYQTLFPEYQTKWRFTPEEFDLFNNDSIVFKIYNNNGFTTYLINGEK